MTTSTETNTNNSKNQQSGTENNASTTKKNEPERGFTFSGISKSAPASDAPTDDSLDAHVNESQPDEKTIKIAKVDDTISKLRHAASSQGYENPDNTGQNPLTDTKVN